MKRIASIMYPPTIALALVLSVLGLAIFANLAMADDIPIFSLNIVADCGQTACSDIHQDADECPTLETCPIPPEFLCAGCKILPIDPSNWELGGYCGCVSPF